MSRPRLWLALAAALTLGASCDTEAPSSPGAPSTRDVVLAPGESFFLQDLAVKFDGVSADSRCPLGVTCIWEGDAVVELVATDPPSPGQALELHTAGQFPREATHGRYLIRLVALSPQPREGQPVAAQDYRATLRVTPQ